MRRLAARASGSNRWPDAWLVLVLGTRTILVFGMEFLNFRVRRVPPYCTVLVSSRYIIEVCWETIRNISKTDSKVDESGPRIFGARGRARSLLPRVGPRMPLVLASTHACDIPQAIGNCCRDCFCSCAPSNKPFSVTVNDEHSLVAICAVEYSSTRAAGVWHACMHKSNGMHACMGGTACFTTCLLPSDEAARLCISDIPSVS